MVSARVWSVSARAVRLTGFRPAITITINFLRVAAPLVSGIAITSILTAISRSRRRVYTPYVMRYFTITRAAFKYRFVIIIIITTVIIVTNVYGRARRISDSPRRVKTRIYVGQFSARGSSCHTLEHGIRCTLSGAFDERFRPFRRRRDSSTRGLHKNGRRLSFVSLRDGFLQSRR